MRSGVLLLQEGNSLLQHADLGFLTFYHGHHLSLHLLQLVLVLFLSLLIGRHQVTEEKMGLKWDNESESKKNKNRK